MVALDIEFELGNQVGGKVFAVVDGAGHGPMALELFEVFFGVVFRARPRPRRAPGREAFAQA